MKKVICMIILFSVLVMAFSNVTLAAFSLEDFYTTNGEAIVKKENDGRHIYMSKKGVITFDNKVEFEGETINIDVTAKNPEIIEIKDSKLQALKVGDTEITVKAGNIATRSAKVTVFEDIQALKERFPDDFDDVIKGDTNEDGRITLFDAFEVLKKAIGNDNPTSEELNAMDMNEDGRITLFDAFEILKLAIAG